MFLQPSEEQDASNEVPNKNEKGIEMEQDFAADAQSVSEDEQLESAMGETGANSEAVDEKLWDKDEDKPPSNSNEKYESGSSVRIEIQALGSLGPRKIVLLLPMNLESLMLMNLESLILMNLTNKMTRLEVRTILLTERT